MFCHFDVFNKNIVFECYAKAIDSK